jgi:DivIVA domain-containing protein
MADNRRLTISSSRMHPDDVARHTFGTTRRGFDPVEVRNFLEVVAGELALAAERERELDQLVAEAERRAANPVLDEATLTAALGQETARVLRTAHDAAAEVTGRATAEAEQLRAGALAEAGQLRDRSEVMAAERAQKAEAEAEDLARRAGEDAAATIDKARQQADALLNQARVESRAMLQEAQDLRTKVLGDLTRRRRILHSQIEQLRAGRERMAETITGVRAAVDAIAVDLSRAEDEARVAAEEAGRHVAAQEGAAGTPSDEADANLATADVGASEVGAAGDTDGNRSGEDDGARKQAVDDLFARLRAADLAGATAEKTEGADEEPTAGNQAEVKKEKGTTSQVGDVTGSVVDEDQAPPDPDLARRDELVQPLVSALTRRLKRALQDDQNDILDRIRARGGMGPKVLPPLKEHQARYAGAALTQLVEAARAGTRFVGATPEAAPPVDGLAEELAATIVAPLRRRLQGESQAPDGDDADHVERVGAAFREWKGARVERLAGDQATAAFGLATLAALGTGASLRWVVDDGAGVQCPDCDDNALAGATVAGEPFPTGHPHPPAHAGCRCLVVPVTT